jgi:hypothetical protein
MDCMVGGMVLGMVRMVVGKDVRSSEDVGSTDRSKDHCSSYIRLMQRQ